MVLLFMKETCDNAEFIDLRAICVLPARSEYFSLQNVGSFPFCKKDFQSLFVRYFLIETMLLSRELILRLAQEGLLNP